MYSWSPMLLRPYCSFCNALLRLSLVVLCVSHARSYVSAFLSWIHLYLYLNHSTTSLAHVFLFKFLGPAGIRILSALALFHLHTRSFFNFVIARAFLELHAYLFWSSCSDASVCHDARWFSWYTLENALKSNEWQPCVTLCSWQCLHSFCLACERSLIFFHRWNVILLEMLYCCFEFC